MMQTELLFPPRLIPSLSHLRGVKWQTFVEQISNKPIGDPERRAFVLLMAKLASCLNCQSDTWRAQQGCEHCAKQTLKKFHGTDEELIALFEVALTDINTTYGVE